MVGVQVMTTVLRSGGERQQVATHGPCAWAARVGGLPTGASSWKANPRCLPQLGAYSQAADTVSGMSATLVPNAGCRTGGVSVSYDEFDTPLGGIGRLSRVKFERTHLEGAAAEVRLIPAKTELSESDAVHVWEGLGKDILPVFDRQSMNLLSLTLTATGHQQTQEKQDGWILASADRTLSVTLYPNLVAIQTTRYDHYRVSLGVPLARALALFVATTGSSVVNRIGLRFINRLQDPLADKPEFWAAHIRDGFSGPLTGSLSRMVDATHQQTQIRLAESAAARIISGVFREEDGDRYSFLVDLDVFREQAFPYDEDLCANLAKQLNRTALSLFSQVVTPAYLDAMGSVPVEEGE